MTPLRKQMIAAMRIRNYSKNTEETYLHQVRQLSQYFNRCPSELIGEEIEEYLLHVIEEQGLSAVTVRQKVAAYRFLYVEVLSRQWMVKHLPYPRSRRKPPEVLSCKEVKRLIEGTKTLRERTLLLVTYGTLTRGFEVLNLKVGDIDRQRKVITIRKGKGGITRQVPMCPGLLNALVEYWYQYRPRDYLFPSRKTAKALGTSVLQGICKRAAKRAGLKKRVYPHLLRHSAAMHLLESDTEVVKLQRWLGHADIKSTLWYLTLTVEHLKDVQSPFELLEQLGS